VCARSLCAHSTRGDRDGVLLIAITVTPLVTITHLRGANLAVGVQAAIGQPCEPGATGVRGMFHFLVVGAACLDRFWAEAGRGRFPRNLA
jgi:hypothetical protein